MIRIMFAALVGFCNLCMMTSCMCGSENVNMYSVPSSSESASGLSGYDNNVTRTDIDAIENALQYDWDKFNRENYSGVVSCNVFNVKITSSYGDNATVSYTLRSTSYTGKKTFVNFKEAKLTKNPDGGFSVDSYGYN